MRANNLSRVPIDPLAGRWHPCTPVRRASGLPAGQQLAGRRSSAADRNQTHQRRAATFSKSLELALQLAAVVSR